MFERRSACSGNSWSPANVLCNATSRSSFGPSSFTSGQAYSFLLSVSDAIPRRCNQRSECHSPRSPHPPRRKEEALPAPSSTHLRLFLCAFASWLSPDPPPVKAALAEARSKFAALESVFARVEEELQEAKSKLERMQARFSSRSQSMQLCYIAVHCFPVIADLFDSLLLV